MPDLDDFHVEWLELEPQPTRMCKDCDRMYDFTQVHIPGDRRRYWIPRCSECLTRHQERLARSRIEAHLPHGGFYEVDDDLYCSCEGPMAAPLIPGVYWALMKVEAVIERRRSPST